MKTLNSVRKLVRRIMSDNGHGMVPLSTHAAPDGYEQAQGCKMDCENCENHYVI